MKDRSSGILMPLFSLPSPYGIGCLGAPARRFADFLREAGQSWWQLLPLVPVGVGSSPYMSPSAFAGEPLFLDLEELRDEGLLTAEELSSALLPRCLDRVDYDEARRVRLPLLQKAHSRSAGHRGPHPVWMDEWAAWAAKTGYLGVSDPDFHLFTQVVFARQWQELRAYAKTRGVKLLGDIPIYVSPHSAEVSSHPELFQLAENGSLAAVAGVPPDYFSEDGQLWGNPLYDWANRPRELADWWTGRIRHAAELYDGLRIDHFRAFHAYWRVPAEAKSAKAGAWVPGPGQELVDRLREAAGEMEIIAEDLGLPDEGTLDFFRHSGLPGMAVLLYAFSPDRASPYLPHNCVRDEVMYTGTHDCPTFLQWLTSEASPEEKQFACDYLGLRMDEGLAWGAVRGAWASPCRLAVAPLQDVLGLGGDARVNLPGTTGNLNWSWRVRAEALNSAVALQLRHLTETYCRMERKNIK